MSMSTGDGDVKQMREMMRSSARDFCEKEVLPLANRLDPEKAEMPDSLIQAMGEMGYFGILIPEDLGGMGLGYYEYCLVAEELARGWMSVASVIARANSLYTTVPGVTEELRRDRIGKMAAGGYLGAIAISEPNAGSDVASVACRATKEDDAWVLSGSKYWCTFADRADYLNIVCRTSQPAADQPRWHGLTEIRVEKNRGSFPAGISASPIPKIGYHGWCTFELAFDGVRTPLANAGEEGLGFKTMASWLEGARAHTAARSIGLAQGALECAIAYAKERKQFGQSIAGFQAIRFKIATMATEIEAARALLYRVCELLDTGKRCDREAAMAKYFASEMSERVTSEALQVLGGAGYTTLYPVERYWRDARLTKIFEGSSEIQQRIISDQLLGRERSGKS